MKTPGQVKADFYAYLHQEFGPGLVDLIKPPPGTKIGERVLYQLRGSQEAERADIEQTNQEFEKELAQLSDQLAAEIDGLHYHTDPVLSSGLPYPRTVDIPHAADLTLGSLAATYAHSSDELPAPDFPIRWLFGVVFTYSARYLLYLDFSHPKLRALYVAEYDVEVEPEKGRHIPTQLSEFITRQAQTTRMVNTRSDIRWAKLVQTDAGLQTTMCTGDKLIQEQPKGAT